MGKTIKDNFELRTTHWFSEWDRRPYFSNTLLFNGKAVLHLPTSNKEFTIDEMIGMYKAKLSKGEQR